MGDRVRNDQAGRRGGAIPPLAGADEIAAQQPRLRPTQAGYVVDERNIVDSGPWQGEPAGLCDSRWGTETPSNYSIKGVQFSKTEADCIRKAWGLERDAFVLDIRKKPMGTYCIEKMDAASYDVLLNDEAYEPWRDCVKDDKQENLEGMLTVEEPSKFEEFAFLSLAFGGGATAVGMGLSGLVKLAKWWWNNRKPPAPPASGGGGGEPAPVKSALPPLVDLSPVDAAQTSKMSMAEKLGLLGLGIAGTIIMIVGGPGVMMGLQGSAAGGAFMVAPGADKGMLGTSNMGPIA